MPIAEFMSQNPTIAYGFIAIIGLLIGSLLNLIIYRLPQMLEAEMQDECCLLLNMPPIKSKFKKRINLFFPRSFCTQCHTTIKAVHNIPILSYLILRGRCAYCRAPISAQYPIVEALSCFFALAAAYHFGFGTALIFTLLFIWIVITACFIDFHHQLLPDGLTLSLLWLGLFANSQSLFTSLNDAVFSAAAAYMFLWLLIQIFYLITSKIGMGNGDFKLFAAFGAWFGWVALPFILVFASLSGAVCGLIYLKITKKTNDSPIPFGPFLILAGLVYLFFNSQILHLYLQTVL